MRSIRQGDKVPLHGIRGTERAAEDHAVRNTVRAISRDGEGAARRQNAALLSIATSKSSSREAQRPQVATDYTSDLNQSRSSQREAA